MPTDLSPFFSKIVIALFLKTQWWGVYEFLFKIFPETSENYVLCQVFLRCLKRNLMPKFNHICKRSITSLKGNKKEFKRRHASKKLRRFRFPRI